MSEDTDPVAVRPISGSARRSTALVEDRTTAVFFWLGTGFVILGGLVAAVTAPLSLAHGSWLAAYLVLVCGAAQCALGLAQQNLAEPAVGPSTARTQLICWNAGNAAVIAGTLTALPAIVDIGGILVVVPLVLTIRAVRNSPRRMPAMAYSAVMALLIVSIPVGLVLSYLRHG